jgi:hypothetical protein
MNVTVHQGKRYQAKIRLGMFEQVASNGTLKERFEGAGFSEVTVQGEGRDRWAFGIWPGQSASAAVPEQVVEVTEIP